MSKKDDHNIYETQNIYLYIHTYSHIYKYDLMVDIICGHPVLVHCGIKGILTLFFEGCGGREAGSGWPNMGFRVHVPRSKLEIQEARNLAFVTPCQVNELYGNLTASRL